MAKKSFYIFLTGLLGMLLFLVLQRVALFLYLYLAVTGRVGGGLTPIGFLAADFISLAVAVISGGWYGVWLGLYWYNCVYEQGNHGGLVKHLSAACFSIKASSSVPLKMAALRDKLEQDLNQIEDVVGKALENNQRTKPKIRQGVKRRVLRKAQPSL